MNKFVTAILVIGLLASIGGNVYFYQQLDQANKLVADPNAVAQKEIDAIVASISLLMELPADEQPTMATVLEQDKLKDQPFFARAQNGDKVIIYTQNKKAILYRPSENRIIEVAPLVVSEDENTEGLVTETPETKPTPVVTPAPVAEDEDEE
jgi:hypothetical protein